ncbi:hypothetical protein BBP40_011376 [Aspergillus hancockii]|nr:hypothetical protein BBP40_011376 [Aspergillus hancockii]
MSPSPASIAFHLPKTRFSCRAKLLVDENPDMAQYFYVPGQSICIAYGTITESVKINIFAEISEEGLPKLEQIGKLVYQQTAAQPRHTLMEVHITIKSVSALVPLPKNHWRSVKAIIEEKIKRVWLEESAEIQKIRWGVIDSGAGSGLSLLVWDQFIPDMTYKDCQEGLTAKATHMEPPSCSGRTLKFLFDWKDLPGSVVNLGAVDDMGFRVSKDVKLRERMCPASVCLLKEQEVLDGFEVAMLRFQSTNTPIKLSGALRVPNDVIVGMSGKNFLANSSLRPLWGRDAQFSAYANLNIDQALSQKCFGGILDLQQAKAAVQRHPQWLNHKSYRKQVTTELVQTIKEYSIFARGQDHGQVAAMPIDSLMTAKIENWIFHYRR